MSLGSICSAATVFSSLRRGILQCHIHDIYVYIFLTLISYYTPVINSMEMTDARVSSDFSSMSQNFTYEGQSASHRYPVVSPVHHTRPFLPCKHAGNCGLLPSHGRNDCLPGYLSVICQAWQASKTLFKPITTFYRFYSPGNPQLLLMQTIRIAYKPSIYCFQSSHLEARQGVCCPSVNLN